jgi:hypothetical protein
MTDEYANFFCNKEYLESVYSLLKGDEKELKKDVLKKMIETIEDVEYESNIFNADLDSTESNIISFEEFCEIFQKIYENSQNPKQIFYEGFSLFDRNKYSFIT